MSAQPKNRNREIQRLSFWGIALNLFLFGGKLLAGFLSGSLAVLADAFNNLSDFLAAVISVVGLKIAQKPPDQDHPYGHGRSEYIAGLFISVLIINVSIEFAKQSWSRILNPQPVLRQSSLTFVVLLVSLGMKLAMGLLFQQQAKRLDSPTLKGMAFDAYSDLVVTGLVILSLLLGKFTNWPLDAYAGLVLALWIAYLGFSLAKDAASSLLGKAPGEEQISAIENLLSQSPLLSNPHDLRVHQYGDGKIIASIHVSVDPATTVYAAHQKIDEVEKRAQEELGIELVIHMDPRGFED